MIADKRYETWEISEITEYCIINMILYLGRPDFANPSEMTIDANNRPISTNISTSTKYEISINESIQ